MADRQRVQVAELLANPSDPNRVISDAGSNVQLPVRDSGPTAQLAQDAPDAGLPVQPTAEEAYRQLLDRVATSRDSGQALTAQDITRVDIALTASDYVGSTRWSFNSLDPRNLLMGYPLGSNKCSLFVAQILDWNRAGPGYPNAGKHFNIPPNAGQWADTRYSIPGWTVVEPGIEPQPGDVAAQGANYLNAFGHVMIVGIGNTLVGTVDGRDVNPQGIVAKIPMKQNIVPAEVAKGPIIFRRFTGH